MFNTPLSEKQTVYSEVEIAHLIREACQTRKMSEEHFLTNVLKEFGVIIPKLERQVLLKLTEDIKKELNKNVGKIAEIIATNEALLTNRRYKGPNIMDRSRAQYIAEFTLMNIDCRIDGKKVKKKEVDAFMGFSERTMRHQQRLYKNILLTPNSFENKLFIDLRRELESLTAQK